MAKKNSAQQAAQKKAKKQKKLLIMLGLGLVVALAFAVNTMMHLGAKPAAATPTGVTATDGSTPDGTDVLAVVPGVTAAPASSLRAFTGFGRKDPFNDGGPSTVVASGAKTPDGSGTPTKVPPVPLAPLTGAVISINNNKLALPLGAKFGHAPGLHGVWLFRLVKATRTTALIAVVGTHQQFTLHVRRPLTLAQNGGWKYTLTLQPVGTATPMTIQPTIHDQP